MERSYTEKPAYYCMNNECSILLDEIENDKKLCLCVCSSRTNVHLFQKITASGDQIWKCI